MDTLLRFRGQHRKCHTFAARPHAISIRWRTSGMDQLPRQHRFEHFNDAWPYTRSAAAKTRELQCHHKPGGCHARRFACPGCMRKHEISLEGCKAVRCDMHTGELSKAGVDSIDRQALGYDGIGRARALPDRWHGGRIKPDGSAVRNGAPVSE